MPQIIVPDTLLEQLSGANDAGFVFISGEQLTGKTSMVKAWLQQQKRHGWLYVDCQYHKLDEALRLEAETILADDQSLQNKAETQDSPTDEAVTQTTPNPSDTAAESPATPYIYTNTAGIVYEQTPHEAKSSRQIVIFDHLPPEEIEETARWLATLIKRHQSQLLFIILDHRRPANVLLKLAFECQGILLSARHCQIRIGDILRARQARNWPMPVAELIETVERAHGHNLVLLQLLNEQLSEAEQFSLPKKEDWARKIFHGLTAPEIAGARLLSALGWTLPTVLKLLLPTLPFQEFLDRLRQRQWLEEHHHKSNLLVRINQPLACALSHFSPTVENMTLRQEKLWTIQLMNRQHVPPSYSLRTWLNVGDESIISIFLDDLDKNNKLIDFAEHTHIADLNQIPDTLINRFSALNTIVYTRAINSADQSTIDCNQARWAHNAAHTQNTPLHAPDPQIQIIQNAHNMLAQRPEPGAATNMEGARLLPAWLEASSRLTLMHTLAGIAHQRPDQNTFAQLEKVALKAAQTHDEDTVINTLKSLALLTLRFGHMDHYVKSTRYVTDWAKHLEKEKAGTTQSLMIIKRPIELLMTPPSTRAIASTRINPPRDAALNYLLNLGDSFSEVWSQDWHNSQGFLARATAHYQNIAPYMRQYVLNPILLRQLFGLTHLSDIDETKHQDLLIAPQLSADDSPYDEPLVHLVTAMIQLHEKSYVSAQSSFEQAQLCAIDLGCIGDLMWCHALAARFYVGRSEEDKALGQLKPLLEMLEHPGIILPIGMLDKQLKPILELANQHRAATPDQITRCRRAFPHLFQEDEQTPTVSALLSKREYEILQYMSEGRSNDEISKLLHRSVGTVKLHAHNIYKKLKVKNRVEAINLYKQSELMAGDFTTS